MTANLSVRRVYWATQETVADWLPTAVNTAGSFDLATDGMLVCGKRTKTATLIWTTTDLWSMTNIGQPFVYSFKQEGTNCGLIAQRAAVVLDTGAYWMGNGKFFMYDGFVKPIPCEVTDYVFGDFKASLSHLVWAYANPKFNEVTWHYPSSGASATDRYVTYNYLEGHWVFGTLTRTAGVTQQPGITATGPVLIGSDGKIYDHENGSAHSAAVPFLESGPIEAGNGDRVMRLQRLVPDDKTLGDVSATIYTSFFPDQTEISNGPYTLASPTSIRLTARQIRVRLTEVAATAWRVGVLRLGVVIAGRR